MDLFGTGVIWNAVNYIKRVEAVEYFDGYWVFTNFNHKPLPIDNQIFWTYTKTRRWLANFSITYFISLHLVLICRAHIGCYSHFHYANSPSFWRVALSATSKNGRLSTFDKAKTYHAKCPHLSLIWVYFEIRNQPLNGYFCSCGYHL